MGAPHSPLDPPKRLSHRHLSPVYGGTHVAAGDSVPESRSDLFLSVLWPWQGCTQLPVLVPSPRHKGPFVRGLQVSLEQKSPSLQYSVGSGCRIHHELVPSSRSVSCGFGAMCMCVFLLRHLGSAPHFILSIHLNINPSSSIDFGKVT